jgi:hypothetical protein
MRDLQKAMIEEKAYVADRMNNTNTSLLERLKQYGYETLDEYFKEKKECQFNEWHPEVYYVDVKTLTTELEKAVQNAQYGIYISTTDGLYAFHGSDDIDYELCNELGVTVAELYHQGGTIIGGVEDLGIEIVAPASLGLEHSYIINKFYEIICQYENDVVIDGNDILVNGEKVLGSMIRRVDNTFVWAAQISFGDHSKEIQKICRKESKKRPGRLCGKGLTRDKIFASSSYITLLIISSVSNNSSSLKSIGLPI